MKRALIFIHRWLGVALCLVFLIWFPSGIGIMYWPFPEISDADRLRHAPPIDPSRIRLSPAEAYATVSLDEEPRGVRLDTFDGRPVYRFQSFFGESVVYADTGDEQFEVPDAMVHRAAEAWTKKPVAGARIEQVAEIDQWTVQMRLDDLIPLWKFSWPDGEEVYVTQTTGEVVQHTTRASRLGAYLGAIPHWLYFTPLRKHGPEWSRVVIWSSGIGTIAAILGVVVGVWMYSPAKRYRHRGAPSRLPYRGQKRWHTVLGLIFGVATVTWTFSGMLSMDPFPRRDAGAPRPAGGRPSIRQALRGDMEFGSFAAKDPRHALAQLDGLPVKALEFSTFAGEPIYIASLASGDTRIVPINGEPVAAFDHGRIVEVVTSAAGAGNVETGLLQQYDRHYLDRRRERPLPVILAQLQDEKQTRYYIDPRTARVVHTYDSDGWVRRWLYNGLHSLNFPWLYNYRPLWDIVVITFMLGGTALCVTSLVLAWRVLGRKLRALVPGTSRGGSSDDLALAD